MKVDTVNHLVAEIEKTLTNSRNPEDKGESGHSLQKEPPDRSSDPVCQQLKRLTLQPVMGGDELFLLGWELLMTIRVDWKTIGLPILYRTLESLLKDYSEVSPDELGTMNSICTSLKMYHQSFTNHTQCHLP